MMKRDQCLKLLAKYHRDELVVPVYQATFEWLAIKPEAPTFTAVGAMGQASSLALGFALGAPDRRVIVLDGDGSLLMNLGSLVTIANAAPNNLLHFVCENGTYEANGGHPIPAKDKVSFTGLALAAGTGKRMRSPSWMRWRPRCPAYCAHAARCSSLRA